MTEIQLQWLSFSKIVFLAVYSLFYGLGGMDGKWKRRYLGSAILTSAILIYSTIQHTFNLWYLLCLPLFIGATSLGYGADNTSEKLFKRAYCGLAYALCALPIAIINHSWLLMGIHGVFCVGFSILLGTFNPTEAREEETIIGFTIGFIPIFML